MEMARAWDAQTGHLPGQAAMVLRRQMITRWIYGGVGFAGLCIGIDKANLSGMNYKMLQRMLLWISISTVGQNGLLSVGQVGLSYDLLSVKWLVVHVVCVVCVIREVRVVYVVCVW